MYEIKKETTFVVTDYLSLSTVYLFFLIRKISINNLRMLSILYLGDIIKSIISLEIIFN